MKIHHVHNEHDGGFRVLGWRRVSVHKGLGLWFMQGGLGFVVGMLGFTCLGYSSYSFLGFGLKAWMFKDEHSSDSGLDGGS